MEGELPYLGDLLTMVINHLLNGMILQVTTPEITSLSLFRPEKPRRRWPVAAKLPCHWRLPLPCPVVIAEGGWPGCMIRIFPPGQNQGRFSGQCRFTQKMLAILVQLILPIQENYNTPRYRTPVRQLWKESRLTTKPVGKPVGCRLGCVPVRCGPTPLVKISGDVRTNHCRLRGGSIQAPVVPVEVFWQIQVGMFFGDFPSGA